MRLAGLALLLVACAPPAMTSRVFLERTLAAKAAFDLQCPREQLQYTDLGGAPASSHYVYDGRPVVILDHQFYLLEPPIGAQQGVSGCGHRGSYTYLNDVWLGSSGAGQLPPQAPPAD